MITDSGTRSSEFYASAGDSLLAQGAATDRPGAAAEAGDAFCRSREQLERIVGWLTAADTDGMEHAQLECWLDTDGRELLRLLLQDHLDLRSGREERLNVVCDERGIERWALEREHRTAARCRVCSARCRSSALPTVSAASRTGMSLTGC